MAGDVLVCNNCKKNVARSNHTVHVVHCQRNVVVCSLCDDPVPRSQYQQHVESAHSAVLCEQCGEKIESVKLFSHQKEECPKRLLACGYCEIEVISVELDAHVEYCGARTDRCKGCSKYVQSKHLQFHYEHDHKYVSPEEKEEADAEGSDNEGSEECPICLGPITLPLALECGHVFCMICVKGIANTTKNCAICRRDIQRDMLMDIRFCREEDIIKNYVNKPKHRKTARSQSVPSKTSCRVMKTTQEYDDMVSNLMSSRTSASNYRYQRPNNTHTPSPYTPYGYSNTSTTSTSTTPSCSSSSQSKCSDNKEVHQQTRPVRSRTRNTETESVSCSSQDLSDYPSTLPSKMSRPASSNARMPSDTNCTMSVNSSGIVGPAPGIKPRRPTTLALKKEEQNAGATASRQNCGSETDVPVSQIEQDRWLAFQLARDEDNTIPSEFNQRHKIPMRRSQSMPERKEGSKDSIESDPTKEKSTVKKDVQNRLPPTSPRCNSGTPAGCGTSSTHGSSLTKSSSDSSATGGSSNSNGTSTGARPKSSTGLKKRVSFKEDGPPVRRQAPVMLPCEFCEEMFSERDLMRHQTSCDKNETKNPREFLESRRSSVSSAPPSPSSPYSSSSLSSPNIASKPPTLPLNRSSVSPSRLTNKTLKTPPQSPSPRPKHTSSSPISVNRSSSNTQLNDGETISRHTSLSPGPGASMSSSSGIGSASSSFSSSSVSTTPSTSSSTSPVPTPAMAETPTDNEAEIEEEEAPLPRPRRGRLLSSAIASWISISGSKPKERPKYTRSNTAPIELTDEPESTDVNSGVTTSLSASHLLHNSPANQSDKSAVANKTPRNDEIENSSQGKFVKTKNKYPAPPPPKSANDESIENVQNIKSITAPENHVKSNPKSNFKKTFKFDSKPLMKGKDYDVIPCEFCQKVFAPEKFQNHQTMCENVHQRYSRKNSSSGADTSGDSSPSESQSSGYGSQSGTQEDSPLPKKHSKGPAPKPPSKKDTLIGRSNSVRERSSSCVRSYDVESSIRRVERASSIKETSGWRGRETSPLSRRWSVSREVLYGRGGIDSSKVYSGDSSLNSSTTSLNSYSFGSARSNYSSMRDDFWSRRSVTSLGLTSPSSSTYLGSRGWERPLSRHRPSSVYGSRSSFAAMADIYLYPSEKRRYLR